MVGAIICLVISIALSLMFGIKIIVDDSTNKFQKLGGIFFVLVAGMFLSFLLLEIRFQPSAIDVYRNKTTLEITETVRDSVVIDRDSVVVWKKKIK